MNSEPLKRTKVTIKKGPTLERSPLQLPPEVSEQLKATTNPQRFILAVWGVIILGAIFLAVIQPTKPLPQHNKYITKLRSQCFSQNEAEKIYNNARAACFETRDKHGQYCN